jgi:predicted enzyme related to lactoylglutathione lyase
MDTARGADGAAAADPGDCMLCGGAAATLAAKEVTMANTNPFRWVEIYVQNIERAKKFYKAVLGFEFQRLESPEGELWAFPMAQNAPGAAGALIKMQGMPSGGNSVIVYFACEDCAVEAKRVIPAGGKIHRDKFPIGEHGFIALALDTEGNMFGLHSMK